MQRAFSRTLAFSCLLASLQACEHNQPGTTTASAESSAAVQAAAEDSRPNIVFILADDLGFSDLGVFGGEIPTPNLDRLATDGMLLTDFYAGLACSPTRAMLMSGMDNHLAGLGVMGVPTRTDQAGQPGYLAYLNFRVASLADLLSDAGYNTYMTGKWHLGADEATGPRARGFKKSFVSIDGAAHLGGWDWRGPQLASYRDGTELVNVDDDFYSTRVYTEKMLEYIEEDRGDGKPFFAWLAYTAPHWPLQAPDASIARFKGQYDAGYEALYESRFARLQELELIPADAAPIPHTRFNPRWDTLSAGAKAIEARKMEIYAAMVSDLDIYVGQVVDYLKRSGEFANTLIMFMSDNGTEASRRDLAPDIAQHVGVEYDHSLENLGRGTSYVMYGANWASATATPLFRHKATAFEGGIHVPAFVHFPGVVAAGSRNHGTGHVMDLLPTFLAIADSAHPGTQYRGQQVLPVQGTSLLPLLRGEVAQVHPADEVLGWELHGQRGIRTGDWKLVWDHTGPAEQRRWYLFNLNDDPFEQNDLSARLPEKFAEMQAHWNTYVEANGVIY